MTVLTWGRYLKPMERYGAQVTYSPTAVTYSSPLLSPGTSVYTWHSRLNFQDARMQGELPILLGKHRYHLASDFTAEPADSVYFKVTIYDQSHDFMKDIIINGHDGDFEYPEHASEYEISLVVKSNQSITFRYLILGEADNFKNLSFKVSPDLKLTEFSYPKARELDVYIGRRDSGSWTVPVQSDHAQIFYRLSNNEINDPAKVDAVIDKLLKAIKQDKQLGKLPTRVRSYGYPLSKINKAKE
ncbi:accessory Sec system protein Asp3 [Fructilactobacillus fructivorans]|nr:accessory Sec system protein Asp3 [Fructilactobacillus fructivorans]